MDKTDTMMRASRAAEFEFYQRNRRRNDRFQSMSDGLLRAVIDAAISAISVDDDPEPEPPPVEEPEVEPEPTAGAATGKDCDGA
jgi:hypothetical protein